MAGEKMYNEDQMTEYKDFHKDPNISKKDFFAKIYREIAAFANASGGKIIVGKEDKTGIEHKQPENIYTWLENDVLTTAINAISDNLIVFSSRREENIVIITVDESHDVISASSDAKGINKGDCFTRENHESVKIQGERLKKLIEKKMLSDEKKTNALRKIVHFKFANGMNHAEKMNIFDSLFVSFESSEKYLNTVFDVLVMNEFLGSYKLPLSKYSTMQMHLAVMAFKKQNAPHTVSQNNSIFEKMMKSDHIRESFFKSQRDEILCNPQLKFYILEHKGVVDGI